MRRTPTEETIAFAARLTVWGFHVYIAEQGNYGYVTDDSEARVLGFSFAGYPPSLSGTYGPPSTMSGTGWRMDETPDDLKSPNDVRKALNAYPPPYCKRETERMSGWRYFTTAAQHRAACQSSSRYERFTP